VHGNVGARRHRDSDIGGRENGGRRSRRPQPHLPVAPKHEFQTGDLLNTLFLRAARTAVASVDADRLRACVWRSRCRRWASPLDTSELERVADLAYAVVPKKELAQQRLVGPTSASHDAGRPSFLGFEARDPSQQGEEPATLLHQCRAAER